MAQQVWACTAFPGDMISFPSALDHGSQLPVDLMPSSCLHRHHTYIHTPSSTAHIHVILNKIFKKETSFNLPSLLISNFFPSYS